MLPDEPAQWKVDFLDSAAIRKSLDSLTSDQLRVAIHDVSYKLSHLGLNVFQSSQAKWLGGGLAEFRHRVNPDVLVRFFFCFEGECVVVVLSAYDKLRAPAASRQQLEIKKARKLLRKL